jgi:hypothetical protein
MSLLKKPSRIINLNKNNIKKLNLTTIEIMKIRKVNKKKYKKLKLGKI